MQEIQNNVIKGLLNDNTSITYMAVLLESETETIKEMLNSMVVGKPEGDTTYNYHIYTKGLNNELVGFLFESSSDSSKISYYKVEKEFELFIEKVLKVNGALESGKVISVYTGEDYKKVLDLTVKQCTDNELDFDYKVVTDKNGETISGNIYLKNELTETTNTSKFNFTLDRVVDGLTSTLKINVENESKDKYEITVDKTNLEDMSSVNMEELEKKLLDYYKDIELVESLTLLIAQPGEE